MAADGDAPHHQAVLPPLPGHAPRQRLRYLGALLSLALGYVALGYGGLRLASLAPTISLVWPASGWALAALLVGGSRLWPGIVLGAFFVNFNSGLGTVASLLIASGNTLEAVVIRKLLSGTLGFQSDFARVRDVLAFLLASTLGAALAATMGSQVFVAVHMHVLRPEAWLMWWMGDIAGIVLFAPLILVWARPLPDLGDRRRVVELIALVLALLWVSGQGFVAWRSGDGPYWAALAFLPFSVWTALRFGRRGAVTFNAAAALCSLFAILWHQQAFGAMVPVSLMRRWWEYSTIIAITGLLLAALRTERRRAWDALAQVNANLESLVGARTAHLAAAQRSLQAEMAARRQLEHHLVQAGELRQRRFGQDLHDGLGQHLTGIAMLGQALAHSAADHCPDLSRQAQRLLELAREAQAESRALALGMYPATLEQFGLEAALRELANFTEQRHAVACTLEFTDLPLISDAVAIHVYRIVQEAVHNAVRHGQAGNVTIALHGDGSHLETLVRDNGCGFVPAVAPKASSLGLNLMHQRAAVLGGQISVRSLPGAGTEVRLSCSCDSEAAA